MRIQFDISEKDAERMARFIPDIKYRHVFAHKALSEWITRQEARDRRSQDEADKRAAKRLQVLIDKGYLNITEKGVL